MTGLAGCGHFRLLKRAACQMCGYFCDNLSLSPSLALSLSLCIYMYIYTYIYVHIYIYLRIYIILMLHFRWFECIIHTVTLLVTYCSFIHSFRSLSFEQSALWDSKRNQSITRSRLAVFKIETLPTTSQWGSMIYRWSIQQNQISLVIKYKTNYRNGKRVS